MEKMIKQKLEAFLQEKWVQNIISTPDFYFEKAQIVLNRFLDYRNEKLVQEILSWGEGGKRFYERLQQEAQSREEVNNLLLLMNTLVAYCDLKALDKDKLNEYEDKRVLAQAGIRQNAWLLHLLKYKVNRDKCSLSIRHAIDYLLSPQTNIPILSEDHRRMIAQLLLKKEYEAESFVRDINAYFEVLAINVRRPENRTYLYLRMIYAVRPEWCKVARGLIVKDPTGWQEQVCNYFVNGGKFSVGWWHQLPQNPNKVMDALQKCLSEKGSFDFYYVVNNEAQYKATVVDFVIAGEYVKKSSGWKLKQPNGYSPDINDYYDSSHKAKILFLFSDMKKLSEPIPYDNFLMFDGTRQLERGQFKAFSFVDFVNGNEMEAELEIIRKILLNKKQIILQGAPGTGKTYLTAALALSVLGIDYDLNDHKEMMKKYRDCCEKKQIYFTTFHQSMDYEYFIEGLKPRLTEDQKEVLYEVESGIFKDICTREVSFDEKYSELKKRLILEKRLAFCTKEGAAFEIELNSYGHLNVFTGDDLQKIKTSITKEKLEKQEATEPNICYISVLREFMNNLKPKKVLIIDEINRGNVSKIFGELITLLESDKRQEGEHPIVLTLPYSKILFQVPSEVYLIGTMNITDRSTGRIDYAVRRRFAFYTLEANESAIRNYYASIQNVSLEEKAVQLFMEIKKYIEEMRTEELELDELMVGHSYFMAKDQESLLLKLNYEIYPLLKEYEKDGMIRFNEILKSKVEEWKGLIS